MHSSQWCRCIETAELLALGDVAEQASLNSFYEDRAAGPRQTADTLRWLQAQMSGPSLMLVTHQVNVTALSGVYPQSGEVVVARIEADGLRVLGTIAPP